MPARHCVFDVETSSEGRPNRVQRGTKTVRFQASPRTIFPERTHKGGPGQSRGPDSGKSDTALPFEVEDTGFIRLKKYENTSNISPTDLLMIV